MDPLFIDAFAKCVAKYTLQYQLKKDHYKSNMMKYRSDLRYISDINDSWVIRCCMCDSHDIWDTQKCKALHTVVCAKCDNAICLLCAKKHDKQKNVCRGCDSWCCDDCMIANDSNNADDSNNVNRCTRCDFCELYYEDALDLM